MRLMSRGNNVKRCDTSCKSAIKLPSLLLLLLLLCCSLHTVETSQLTTESCNMATSPGQDKQWSR